MWSGTIYLAMKNPFKCTRIHYVLAKEDVNKWTCDACTVRPLHVHQTCPGDVS